VLDLEHLARMTLGERRLEAEVLTLFHRQAGMLLARMQGAPPRAAAAFAHTLKGSARGIGAWRVAKAAAAVERGSADATAALAAAVAEVQAVIDGLVAERL